MRMMMKAHLRVKADSVRTKNTNEDKDGRRQMRMKTQIKMQMTENTYEDESTYENEKQA